MILEQTGEATSCQLCVDGQRVTAVIISLQATWHPVYDLVVAGRYPDDRVCPGEQRTVDIYDANTAELVYQLQDPAAAGIKSVSMFFKNHKKNVWRQENCCH